MSLVGEVEGPGKSIPATLGYLSNPEELSMLQDTEYQERLALALYQGVRGFAKAKKETVK